MVSEQGTSQCISIFSCYIDTPLDSSSQRSFFIRVFPLYSRIIAVIWCVPAICWKLFAVSFSIGRSAVYESCLCWMPGRNFSGMSPPFSSRRGMRASLPGHAARSRAAPTWWPSQISPLFTSFPHIPSPPTRPLSIVFFFFASPTFWLQQPRATRRDKLWRTQPFIFLPNPCLCRALNAPHPPVHDLFENILCSPWYSDQDALQKFTDVFRFLN